MPDIARLKHMQELLRQPLPPGTFFDLAFWRMPAGLWRVYEQTTLPEDQQHSDCGTVCCAIGLGVMDPTFQAQGLGWREETRTVLFDGKEDFDAVTRFFGIKSDEAYHLFSINDYGDDGRINRPTRQNVIDRIQKLIDFHTVTTS